MVGFNNDVVYDWGVFLKLMLFILFSKLVKSVLNWLRFFFVSVLGMVNGGKKCMMLL